MCEDKVGFIRNAIPPPMHYPSSGVGHLFAQGLINFFYNTSLVGNFSGIWSLIVNSMPQSKKSKTE